MDKRLVGFSVLLGLVIILLLQGCGSMTGFTTIDQEVTQEEALKIAQDFVNTHVRFFVDEDKSIENVKGVVTPKASIVVTNIAQQNGEWVIELIAQAEKDGEVKKAGMIVTIDAKTGEVKKDKLRQFRLNE
ncbi:hypothetical protein FJZ53_02395 [Candidatus Woesearchaeota archaeon]|nr:hypothetical protein [Candidatus Woesearchaeota archaeon]